MTPRIQMVQKLLYSYAVAVRRDWGRQDGRCVRDDLVFLGDLCDEVVTEADSYEDCLERLGIDKNGSFY